jgi:hypothetical protein
MSTNEPDTSDTSGTSGTSGTLLWHTVTVQRIRTFEHQVTNLKVWNQIVRMQFKQSAARVTAVKKIEPFLQEANCVLRLIKPDM